MLYLGLGVVVLIFVLGLSRAFVTADPAKLAQRFGRFVGAVQRRRQAARDRPPPRSSEVETDCIRMRLDHDSGTMAGIVRRGVFAGRRLDELTRSELLALWRQCRVEDEPGANLLEAYLDRLMPDWRAEARRGGSGGGGKGGARSADAMTRAEAYEVLGLSWGAGESEIREAHRRLMMKLHPDQGGSTYLAAKLNRAREILLRG
ncbi:MAG TPA: DnaJ domain-containing protein [Stellaceae bacterium]|nr:DnaJ domain-containing protein [Stellaceae bacterium]